MKLAYPYRYGDIVHHLARPVPHLSIIMNLVINKIYGKFAMALPPWTNLGCLGKV